MNQILIAPSILSADFSRLGEESQNVAQHGANSIHVDVMDGHFVPNITIGACVVQSLHKISSLPLDVHLMIENPEKYIPDFINAGSAHFKGFYEILALKIALSQKTFLHIGYSLYDFQFPNNLMLGVGYRFGARRK